MYKTLNIVFKLIERGPFKEMFCSLMTQMFLNAITDVCCMRSFVSLYCLLYYTLLLKKIFNKYEITRFHLTSIEQETELCISGEDFLYLIDVRF